jgi:hypothetical protein
MATTKSLNSNDVSKSDFLIYETDSFDDTQITKLRTPFTLFLTKSDGLVSTEDVKDGFDPDYVMERTDSLDAKVRYACYISRFESAGDDLTDECRLNFEIETDVHFTRAGALEVRPLCDLTEVIFNCDQKLLRFAVEKQKKPVINALDAVEHNCMVTIPTASELLEIGSSNELKIRLVSEGGNIDCKDRDVKRAKDAIKLFYNQAYDETVFEADMARIKPQLQKSVEFEEGSGCFLATAVYESRMDPELVTLRSFRDNVLSGFACGRAFIAFYYKVGPRLAQWVVDNSLLKTCVRYLVSYLVRVINFFS